MVFIVKHIKNHADAFHWMIEIIKPFRIQIIILSLISMVSSVTGVGFAMLTRRLIDTATGAQKSAMGMLGVSLALGGIVLFQLAIQSFLSVYSTNTTEKTQNHIRQRIFRKICNAPWLSLGNMHSGDIMTRVGGDVTNITSIHVSLIPQLAALTSQLIAAFLALMSYDGVMAAAAFLIGPIVMLFARLYGRKLKPLYEKYQQCNSAERSFLQESIQNILLIKTFNLFNPFLSKLDTLQKNKTSWVYKRNHISILANAGMSLGYWIGVLVALLWGSYRLSLGVITFGTVTAFIQLVSQVQGPFIGLAGSLPRFIQSSASAERLMVIDNLPEEPCTENEDLSNIRAGLTLQNVNCGYKTEKDVLHDLSIQIKPGEMIGIMGPTGDGKTTLIRLILSLIQPEKGSACLYTDDGKTLDITPKTRNFFSYVPQGNSIFSGTIAENLRLGDPTATNEELVQALKDAWAWDFVSLLPQKLDAFIGEKGATLSEGQSQRIAIARALLHKAPILLLDEATSALDANTEKKVIQSIHQKNRTCIFVSHHTILFDECDSVYQILKGQLTKVS